MEGLYLYNTVEGIGKGHTYIGSRTGPAKLEDLGLTLVHPFYNEEVRFNKQFDIWSKWSDYVRDRVKIVIVDDGSPKPVTSYIKEQMDATLSNFNFSIYRIRQNLKWNTPGALNLGLFVAPTDWVLIMDSDCALDDKHMRKLLSADPEPFAVYKFPRKRFGKGGDNLSNRRYLPCTMLFHRSLFMDKLGGFDEDYTGEYSRGYAFFDTDFDERAYSLTKENPMFIWNEVVAIEWMSSIVGNEIVTRSKKDEKVNRKLLYRKREAREKTLDVMNPSPILRFDWDLVYYQERK